MAQLAISPLGAHHLEQVYRPSKQLESTASKFSGSKVRKPEVPKSVYSTFWAQLMEEGRLRRQKNLFLVGDVLSLEQVQS